MTFSQRYGYTPVKDALQFESMDKELRNSLWNVVYVYLGSPSPISGALPDPVLRIIYKALWADFFKLQLDDFNPRRLEILLKHLKGLIIYGDWYEAFDVIEFIASMDSLRSTSVRFRQDVNSLLKREVSGYRFVSEQITPITDQLELGEIETALAADSRAVSSQLEQALQYLSDRQSPDYRNSIKESISAVESEVRSTLGKEKGTLGQLLPELQKELSLHPALTEAFSKLYGYTSDEGGIRHALMDDSRTVTFEEAKFMLVACSAFINYVRGATKT